jgi:hypothetical protein
MTKHEDKKHPADSTAIRTVPREPHRHQIGTVVQVREGEAMHAGIIIGLKPDGTADAHLFPYTGGGRASGHLEGLKHDDTLAEPHTFKIVSGGV